MCNMRHRHGARLRGCREALLKVSKPGESPARYKIVSVGVVGSTPLPLRVTPAFKKN